MIKLNLNKSSAASSGRLCALKRAAALIIAAILAMVLTACPQSDGGGGTPPAPPTKYAITFSVDSTTPNGTLKAKADGVDETSTSPITVEEGKTVTFTATPNSGYKVKEWKVGNDIVTGNTSNTYTCTVTKAVTVKVSFLAGETPYKVKHYQEKEEGGYPAEPTETENKTGTVGTNAEYTPKTGGAYEGFTYKSDLTKVNGTVQPSGTIKPDGSTVVELFYERNFVKIIPPTTGIVGVDPDYTLPGTDNYWKGVFRAGRKVKLSPYKLGKTEVTYKLWKEVYDWAVKAENGYKFASEGVKGSDGTGNDEEQPVTTISWRDCIVWCNAYTAKTMGEGECVYRKKDDHTVVLKDATDGAACDAAYADMSKKGFRLPTEAEWEYAARRQNNNENAVNYGEGGSEVYLTKLNSASGAKKPIGFSGLTLPEGETWESLRDEVTRVAVYKKWFDGSNWVAQPTKVTKTAAVKSKAANAIGLYDMSGNVWEWCFDWYGDIEANTVTDPQGGASGTRRVFRGGSWNSLASTCTVGRRDYISPDGRYDNLGFRLACRP